MARTYSYIRKDGEVSPSVSEKDVMEAAGRAVKKGEGKFKLVVNGEQEGHDKTRSEVLDALARNMGRDNKIGDVFRVRDSEDVVFSCREVKAAAQVINTSGNKKTDAFWTALVDRFGKDSVLFMGAYTCKPSSQHRFGNAVDAGNKANGKIVEMAEWAVRNAPTYDIRNVIVQDRIWHIGEGWSHYSLTPHVSHIHVDFNPTYDTSLPCGVRG